MTFMETKLSKMKRILCYWACAMLACAWPVFAGAQEEDEPVYSVVQVMPQFPGGQTEFFKYLGQNIVYPAPAIEQGIEGRTICQFIVEKDGAIRNVSVVRSSGDANLDNEALRVMTMMPNWTPGRQGGENVRVKFTAPVIFKLPPPPMPPVQEEVAEVAPLQDDKPVFSVVQVMPQFPGGQEALFAYLENTVKYPVIAYENGIQGRVLCQFVVNKDGSISNVEVAKSGGDPSLDKEAIRVIKMMPNWIPGRQDGENVRVKYSVPVVFKLDKKHK